MNSRLFPYDLWPGFLDQESLYSWCARVHRLSGGLSSKATSKQLFGEKLSGARTDFPTPLNYLLGQVGSALGSAESILVDRTMFGFYQGFLPVERCEELADAVMNGPFSRVHYALGLSASLSFTSRCLKFCRHCLREQANDKVGWWKINEQWPAVFVCKVHGQPLDRFLVERGAGWLLPIDALRAESLGQTVQDGSSLSHLAKISQICSEMLQTTGLDLQTETLRYCYLFAARDRGLLSMDGALRLADLRDDWLKWAGTAIALPELLFAKEVGGVNAGFIGQLVRSYPGIRHPLKHFLLIAYLFDGVAEFRETNKIVSDILRNEGTDAAKNHLCHLRTKLAALVVGGGKSVNAAAGDIGVAPSQAIKYLKKARIEYERRPRIVGTSKEERLVELLQCGSPRSAICTALNLRNSFIKDYLAHKPVLRSTYQAASLERTRGIYRSNFLRIVKMHPSMRLKEIQKIPQNGYQWLRRNDAEWLSAVLPSLWG
ncbi:TnsD family Tn7-like transposition protein [uncultured Herbaspirillum sp.]|uniref:TnsD family Tn7-like transposition protein n=1 Tax=uncultured Herbaspirillum sp. TaxID=160236 RepID=UPI0025840AA0|nr:TnsD family Tn7-like transposition protein [uncultured Herbaspirillum sp.]